MQHAEVFNWLRTVDTPIQRVQKRKRPSPPRETEAPLSPPSSASNLDDMEMTPKRPRLGQTPSACDNEETPRASLPLPHARSQPQTSCPSSVNPSESASNSASQASRDSHASQSKKRRRDIQHGPEPVDVLNFSMAESGELPLPSDLEALLREFEKANAGAQPVISSDRRAEIKPPRRDIYDNAFGDDVPHSPPFHMVREIVGEAAECYQDNFDEAAWNAKVHLSLLQMAFPKGESMIKVIPCTSASSHRNYLPAGCPKGKMVDFCLAIDPHWPQKLAPTAISEAIAALQEGMPLSSINHTGYQPLCRRPIVASIETKKFGGASVEESPTQLGVWQTAQWHGLETLAARRAQPTGQNSTLAGPAPALLGGLSFLPGIIIVGHDWKFAATTKEPGSRGSRIWCEGAFGSTMSELGVYRIIWCLRRLEKYVMEQYWPWYKQTFLALPDGPTGMKP